MTDGSSGTLLAVGDLAVACGDGRSRHLAVHGIDFTLEPGRSLAVIGEEDAGHALVARALVGALPADARVSGRIALDGQDLITLPTRARRRLAGARIGYCWPEATDAFHPLLTVGEQLVDVIGIHLGLTGAAATDRARAALERVGTVDPEAALAGRIADLQPSTRHRAMLALALSCDPALLVIDQPPVPLDPLMRAQLIGIVRALRRASALAVVLVTQEIELAAALADDAILFYAGEAVEQGPIATTLGRPAHPYTRGLMGAVPLRRDFRKRLTPLAGHAPWPGDWPDGCRFAPRCGRVDRACIDRPPLERHGAGSVRCFHPHQDTGSAP